MGSLMHQSDPSPTRVDVEASLLIIGPLLTGEVVKGCLVLFFLFCFQCNSFRYVQIAPRQKRRGEKDRSRIPSFNFTGYFWFVCLLLENKISPTILRARLSFCGLIFLFSFFVWFCFCFFLPKID